MLGEEEFEEKEEAKPEIAEEEESLEPESPEPNEEKTVGLYFNAKMVVQLATRCCCSQIGEDET